MRTCWVRPCGRRASPPSPSWRRRGPRCTSLRLGRRSSLCWTQARRCLWLARRITRRRRSWTRSPLSVPGCARWMGRLILRTIGVRSASTPCWVSRRRPRGGWCTCLATRRTASTSTACGRTSPRSSSIGTHAAPCAAGRCSRRGRALTSRRTGHRQHAEGGVIHSRGRCVVVTARSARRWFLGGARAWSPTSVAPTRGPQRTS